MPHLTIKLTYSELRWLKAFAKANCSAPTSVFEAFAVCLRDFAGARTGSWEADVAATFARSSGFHQIIEDKQLLELLHKDEAERLKFLRKSKILQHQNAKTIHENNTP